MWIGLVNVQQNRGANPYDRTTFTKPTLKYMDRFSKRSIRRKRICHRML